MRRGASCGCSPRTRRFPLGVGAAGGTAETSRGDAWRPGLTSSSCEVPVSPGQAGSPRCAERWEVEVVRSRTRLHMTSRRSGLYARPEPMETGYDESESGIVVGDDRALARGDGRIALPVLVRPSDPASLCGLIRDPDQLEKAVEVEIGAILRGWWARRDLGDPEHQPGSRTAIPLHRRLLSSTLRGPLRIGLATDHGTLGRSIRSPLSRHGVVT